MIEYPWTERVFSYRTERQRERLKKTIARGKQSFVWTRGVLLFGMMCFAFSFILDFVISPPIHHLAAPDLVRMLVVRLVIWLVAGYIWGLYTWGHYNRVLWNYSK